MTRMVRNGPKTPIKASIHVDNRIHAIEKELNEVKSVMLTMKDQIDQILLFIEKQLFPVMTSPTDHSLRKETRELMIQQERFSPSGKSDQNEEELKEIMLLGGTIKGDTFLEPNNYVTKGQLISLVKLLRMNEKGTPTELSKIEPRRSASVESSHLNQLWLRGFVHKKMEGRRSVYMLTKKGKQMAHEELTRRKKVSSEKPQE